MELTIIIPAYNEEESIKDTIRSIKKYNPKCGIIVVDDNSKDKTKDIAKNENVKVISHKSNQGYGAALKTGMLEAKSKYVGFLDADMTYNPKYFPKMLDYMKNDKLDIIWGSRFGGNKNKMSLIRKIGNRFFVLFFFLITGKNVGDCASGQRILKTNIFNKIELDTLPDGLEFTPALSKRIISRGLRYKAVPINYENRRGSSKLSLIKHGYRMLKNIILEK